MYYVSKQLEISGAHHLNLDYESKCTNVHGHNWQIEVFCKAKELNRDGMVVDFSAISSVVRSLDHQDLNKIIDGNPTAENIARWICERVPNCYKVSVKESAGNTAIYEKD
ncbi:MAG: 6-carboxytetrahydropterin synthase [Bacteroidales bacterium]|nr:6-carboxytetrahydropterin synthase [Candidatus Colimorpha merdihippi]MCQ2281463.1 6-carboxytetrahydropterin synthase [Bacteroidales bacterium]